MHSPLALLFVGVATCLALAIAVALSAWSTEIQEFFYGRRKR